MVPLIIILLQWVFVVTTTNIYFSVDNIFYYDYTAYLNVLKCARLSITKILFQS